MARTISETERRRAMQIAYNEEHGMVPTPLNKSKEVILKSTKVADGDPETRSQKGYYTSESDSMAAEPKVNYADPEELEKAIAAKRKQMEKAAKELDFIEAARLRDELFELQAKR
ncbi:UvrABC system protein B [compost metagenome]